MRAKRIYECPGLEGAAHHPSLSDGTGANREAQCSVCVCVGGGGVHFCHYQFRCQGSFPTNPSERIHKFVEGADLHKDPNGVPAVSVNVSYFLFKRSKFATEYETVNKGIVGHSRRSIHACKKKKVKFITDLGGRVSV